VELQGKTERLSANREQDLLRAATLLRRGETVAFPTETVYGLGADALSAAAVEKIFTAKQRPHWDPLIVHVADYGMLAEVATCSAAETRLLDAFWPGPLTLLLPRTPAVPDAVTAGRPLVGVRMPRHPVALKLIRLAGVPIAAPSANRFGHTSPTTAQHVLDDLDGRIAAVLDGGATEVGLESTVAQVVDDGLVIYRAGQISEADLEGSRWNVIGDHGRRSLVRFHAPVEQEANPASLPSPGVGIRHYAPRARLVLVDGLHEEQLVRSRRQLEWSLVDAIDRSFDGVETLGVMLPDGWNGSCAQLTYRWGPWHEQEILAHRLYDGLRSLDRAGASVIVCPVPESYGIATAIRDRLRKAARAE
jgi:L-threonylcarbamoyladenylate synthase